MKTILIVEDDQQYRDLLKKKLTDTGNTVLSATNGNQALSMVQNNTVDLIVLDLLLPGMDGLTFYYQMKNNLKMNIPTIILSNLTESPYQADILDFIVKTNVSLDDVVARIEKYLG